VALGDSLAAGITPLGVDRIPVNGVDLDFGYPNYLIGSLKAEFDVVDFDNFGVSGYKTSDVIAQLNKADVQKEIKEATHVTIDIGANDILPVLQQDSNDPTKAQAAIVATAANINTILSKIDQLNSKAKVYVMGYYNPFPYYYLVLTIKSKHRLLSMVIRLYQPYKLLTAVFQKYLPNPQNIHLSLLGYQVVAGEFWKVIK
jgi:lysophospholipase L1-like esterase